MVPRYSVFIEPGCGSCGLVSVNASLEGGLLSGSPDVLSSGHSLRPLVHRRLLESQKVEDLDVWRLQSCVRLSDWKFLC